MSMVIIKEREHVTEKYYRLEFTDEYGNGYSFDCDSNGNLEAMEPAALKNYQRCIDHPEEFKRYNRITPYTRRWTEPAIGLCECGEEVEMISQYMGALECPKCGRWYNLFGQQLNPPSMWRDY